MAVIPERRRAGERSGGASRRRETVEQAKILALLTAIGVLGVMLLIQPPGH